MFNRILLTATLLLFLQHWMWADFTVSGYVRDASSGESIIGVNVYSADFKHGTSTNTYGFYSLSVPEGSYDLRFSFVGYTITSREIVVSSNIELNIELEPITIVTGEAVVTGEKSELVESTDMGRMKLEMEQVKTLPALLGEVDVLKTIQLLPGIQSAGEGNSGFYVRGGGPDQNLILLDNATVYNPSHLFGFFSVFNPDAVKHIDIIKGGMPAIYGGRLSSVLDVALNEGNNKRYRATGGIGVISSRLTVEGPIVKDKSSFIVSARRTYIDVLLRPFIDTRTDYAGSSYFFYDLNAKLNYRLNDKNQLFLSGYFGRDEFGFADKEAGFKASIPWGNGIASARWTHLFSPKLFMNTSVNFSDYTFQFGMNYGDFDFRLTSGIRDWSGKVQFNYYQSYRHEAKWGIDYTYHQFTPTSVKLRSGDTDFNTGTETVLYSHEAALYVSDSYDFTEKFRVTAGVRLSYFAHVGPYVQYTQEDRGGISQIEGRTEKTFQSGQIIADYLKPEPRLAMRYSISEKSSVKASYTHNYQFIHLASLSATSLPTDIWVPSTDRVKPQFGQQYAVGYFQTFMNGMFDASVEVYYKDMRNLVEYKEGTLLEDQVNDNIDNHFTYGRGHSYGIEIFLNKKLGDFTGWIGYTLSRTERIFAEINEGNPYPAKFDRTHDLSVVLSYKLKERWVFTTTFVYGTGNAITLPVERYFIEGRIVDVYGPRNSFRMDPYHRWDLGVTYNVSKTKFKRNKETGEKEEVRRRIDSSFTLSVYNVYNRKNPYFIYFTNEGDLQSGQLDVAAKQVSLFPVLPSVTWNFKF
ncbi:MAG: carboxypeptidase-like regulatory domain-containing protein [Flavobacteriales bacterium]|nr:carboxypeptidase-like regulatory domain-containing protein [Flavobacteriales bacterium]